MSNEKKGKENPFGRKPKGSKKKRKATWVKTLDPPASLVGRAQTVPNGELKGESRWGKRRLRFLDSFLGRTREAPQGGLGGEEKAVPTSVLDTKNRRAKREGNTGKNLVETPYVKPTQVGGCGRHSGLRRMNSKELGQFAP